MKIDFAGKGKTVPYRDIKAGEAWSFGLSAADPVYMKTSDGDVDLRGGQTFVGDQKTFDDEDVFLRKARIVIDSD